MKDSDLCAELDSFRVTRGFPSVIKLHHWRDGQGTSEPQDLWINYLD